MSKLSHKRVGSCCTILTFILTFTQSIGGKTPPLPGGYTSAGDSTRPSLEATPTEKAPKLDGTLNDPLWQLAAPITDFWQREPERGKALLVGCVGEACEIARAYLFSRGGGI
jgi:hypothetical protein